MNEENFEIYMNQPVPYIVTDQDILAEYLAIGDKKKVAAVYLVPVSAVTAILKKAERGKQK